jgi:hypothetical protein
LNISTAMAALTPACDLGVGTQGDHFISWRQVRSFSLATAPTKSPCVRAITR